MVVQKYSAFYERSLKWSDVAILAFTFCSRVLFVLNMAEKQT